MTDAELVRQVLAGETEAYEELVRRWTGRILAVCRAKVGRGGAAEDLTQETLLRGYRAISSLTEHEKFGSWLHGIATHACLDWLKSRQRSHIAFSALGPGHNPDDLMTRASRADAEGADHEDELRQLRHEVEGLPEECREVVLLYYYGDGTYRDLAHLLGVSPATINARLTRARSLLRQRLSHCRG